MRATRTEDTMTTTLRWSLLGAIIVFAFAACGVGETDNTDDGTMPPPDTTCTHDCGGSTPNPDDDTTGFLPPGAVENLTADRNDPWVMLSWTPAENAIQYGITRIKGAWIGVVNVTSFQDTLPADHIGVAVSYRVTPVGQGYTLGQPAEVMTQPNVPPVEDPPGTYYGEGDEDAILAMLGQGTRQHSNDPYAFWHGVCNDGTTRDVLIQIDETPEMDGNYLIVFYTRAMNSEGWGGYNLKTLRSGLFVALRGSGEDQSLDGINFLCRFSADPQNPSFEGGGEGNSANYANPPCRFTPAPEDPGN